MFPTRLNPMPRGLLAVGPRAFAVALVCAVAIAVSTPAAAAVAGNKDLAMAEALVNIGVFCNDRVLFDAGVQMWRGRHAIPTRTRCSTSSASRSAAT
jgi:hypothetical protein